ncbi:MAG: SDR family NAD(P)-dependent oxidoreductase [Sphingomonas sp.]|nr:MAG: SDR family NAD(P)-dependent oxidoreductase [Sphingomonas sp.]
MNDGRLVLVTGGAGFIGRAVCRALLADGARVRVLDSLIEQVHGGVGWPADLPGDVERVAGDVRDPDAVRTALRGVDSVIHLAAEVGVGQSMYAIERYTSVNELGTAVLLEAMVAQPVRRIVTASSMSIYGEGRYTNICGEVLDAVVRDPAALRAKRWDPVDPDGSPLTPAPTPEGKEPQLASVYAIGKYVQERMPMTVAAAYGMEAVALRLWNVFGPGQALSNPYTGVLAIFAAKVALKRPPMIFEDGLQQRDFVHVDDVARAFVLALEEPAAAGRVFNIASGTGRTVLDVAHGFAAAMGTSIELDVTGEGRSGDIRHCLADIGRAREVLGYAPRENFDHRLIDLAEWVIGEDATDSVATATAELRVRGLVS